MGDWVQDAVHKEIGGVREFPYVLSKMRDYALAWDLKEDESTRQDLADRARACLEAYRDGARQGPAPAKRVGRPTTRATIRPDDRLRADVMAAAVRRQANAEPDVVAFRSAWGLPRKTLEAGMRGLYRRLVSLDQGGPWKAYQALAQRLADKYGWSRFNAEVFILTGNTVPVLPLLAFKDREFILGGSGIVLEIQPWVSAESVRAVYAKVQKGVLGKAHRGITEEALKRFAFAHAARVGGARWKDIYERCPSELLSNGMAKHQRKDLRRKAMGKKPEDDAWRRLQGDCARTEKALLPPSQKRGRKR